MKSELNVLLGWKNNTLPDKESIGCKIEIHVSANTRHRQTSNHIGCKRSNRWFGAEESADRLLGKREEQLNVLKKVRWMGCIDNMTNF